MSKILLEADFETINLDDLFKNQTSSNNDQNNGKPQQNTTKDGSQQAQAQPKPKNTNWEKELASRLEANKKLSQEAKQSDYAVESEFFKEFYVSVWGEEIAKQLLLIGDLLKKSFKTLGFVENTNPIYKFLTLDYTKTNLLQTKLINVNTFKAIYRAVANKLVADSEFFKANTYNIIYCRDWYNRSSDDMEKYLKLQNIILPANASKYTAQMLRKNRRVFLLIDSNTEPDLEKRAVVQKKTPVNELPAMTDTNAKLNSYELAKVVHGIIKISGESTSDPDGGSTVTVNDFTDKVTTPAQTLATMQFLSMTTGSKKASAAMSHEKLASVSAADLLKATEWLIAQKLTAQTKLTTTEAEAIVDALLGKL